MAATALAGLFAAHFLKNDHIENTKKRERKIEEKSLVKKMYKIQRPSTRVVDFTFSWGNQD